MSKADQAAANKARSKAAKIQGLGKESKGGPVGNNFKGEAASIKDAIRYVMTNYEKGEEVERGQALKAIVKKAVEDAIDGDKNAREWLSDRLEGKAVTITESTLRGDPDRPLSLRVIFGN
jgi:hypothetical protein